MATFRCTKHDVLFDTTTDSRMPGSLAKGNLPAHPANGHPDCELCQAEASETSKPVTSVGNTGKKTFNQPEREVIHVSNRKPEPVENLPTY